MASPWVALDEIVSVSPTLATVVTGLALRGARRDSLRDLKEGGGSVVAGVRSFDTLAVVEIGLAVALFAVAELLSKKRRPSSGHRPG